MSAMRVANAAFTKRVESPVRAVPVAGALDTMVQCCAASDGGDEPKVADAALWLNVGFGMTPYLNAAR